MSKTAGKGPQADMLPGDVYFKKNITWNFRGHSLVFRTSQELFSSHDIDLGTQFLMRGLDDAALPPPGSILDLGCGYGPLGLTLKKLYPGSIVHLVDRDALAVEYTAQNALLNGLEGVEVYGSLGYDDIRRNKFDLIVSNIPGKAGEKVINHLLLESGTYLSPGGMIAVVVVSALDEMVNSLLEDSPGVEVILKRNRSGHSVFHFRFREVPPAARIETTSLERGVYLRDSPVFNFSGQDYPMQTVFGLPEFDSLDRRSELLMKFLEGQSFPGLRKAAVLNPGQGHTAVLIHHLFQPQEIALVDRDLLALRTAGMNLELNHCHSESIRLFQRVGLPVDCGDSYDLITAVLREEEGEHAMEQTLSRAASALSPQGLAVFSAGSTAITRLAAFLHRNTALRLKHREKWKGCSLLIFST